MLDSMQAVLAAEGGYTVRPIQSDRELRESYKLRHAIFAEELKWVPEAQNGLETDQYDPYSVPLGVFNPSGSLVSHLRIIPTEMPFMMEKEFFNFVSKRHTLKKHRDTAEITRLCVAPEFRGAMINGFSPAMFLFKGLYIWCNLHGIRHQYFAVEYKVLRMLRISGFPSDPIGEPVRMRDGTLVIAATLDWSLFERINSASRPRLLNWFSQGRSSPAVFQRLRPVSSLPRPVFA